MQFGDPRWTTPTNQLVRFHEPRSWSPRTVPQEWYRKSRSSDQLEQRLTNYYDSGRGGAFYIRPGAPPRQPW